MNCDLVSVETNDGIVLHGALFATEHKDLAVIIMHGAAMNFYTGLGRFLPPILRHHGITCLTANNRGHDFGTAPDNDRKPVIGLMRDRFRDCTGDFKAWTEFLNNRGYPNLVLVGHSQGVFKIIYAMSEEHYSAVKGLVLVSPPPSIKEMIRYLVSGNLYERGLFKAQELAGMGIHEQLIVLKGKGTMPWIFTVDTFLDLYGPGGPPDTATMAKKIKCPMLLVRGSRDFPPVSSELLKNIKARSSCPDQCTVIEVEGADHFYSERESELGLALVNWLNRLQSGQQ